MSLSKLQEIVKDREAWHTAVHGVTKSLTRQNRTTTKKSKYLGIHLMKHVLYLYAENVKMLLKEELKKKIKRHSLFMDWKTQHSKDVYFPQTDSFNSISIKILTRLLFGKMDKIILKCTWKGKGIKITSLKNNNKVRRITTSDFKTLYSYSNHKCVALAM